MLRAVQQTPIYEEPAPGFPLLRPQTTPSPYSGPLTSRSRRRDPRTSGRVGVHLRKEDWNLQIHITLCQLPMILGCCRIRGWSCSKFLASTGAAGQRSWYFWVHFMGFCTSCSGIVTVYKDPVRRQLNLCRPHSRFVILSCCMLQSSGQPSLSDPDRHVGLLVGSYPFTLSSAPEGGVVVCQGPRQASGGFSEALSVCSFVPGSG